MNEETDSPPWLALLHQLPAKPPYLRVKIWRRLQAIGAVPLKNAVHVLPPTVKSEAAFRDLMADISESGGEAILIRAQLLAGQTDADVRDLFDAARDADYADIADTARRLIEPALRAGVISPSCKSGWRRSSGSTFSAPMDDSRPMPRSPSWTGCATSIPISVGPSLPGRWRRWT